MAYTQKNRLIAIETPLGKDELILTAFRGTEGMSRLFSFDLVALSHNQGIAFEKIVGKNVTVSVALADNTKRYFNGIVSRFTQTGAGRLNRRRASKRAVVTVSETPLSRKRANTPVV